MAYTGFRNQWKPSHIWWNKREISSTILKNVNPLDTIVFTNEYDSNFWKQLIPFVTWHWPSSSQSQYRNWTNNIYQLSVLYLMGVTEVPMSQTCHTWPMWCIIGVTWSRGSHVTDVYHVWPMWCITGDVTWSSSWHWVTLGPIIKLCSDHWTYHWWYHHYHPHDWW